MLTIVSGKPRSGAPANSSTTRAQSGQGQSGQGPAQQQSATSNNAPAKQQTLKQGEASGRPAPTRSNTTSTPSAPVHHDSFISDERLAKLSGEGENRARRLAAIENAFNKYKQAIDAEARAKKAYMDDKKKTDSDLYMCGQDYFTAGRVAAEHGNAWEKAAHSAAVAYEALKRAVAQ